MKAEKRPSSFILDDTEHSYSRKTTVSGHSTPLKQKRNRNASTPTGETPKVIEKKTGWSLWIYSIFTKEKEREREIWTDEWIDRQIDRLTEDRWINGQREGAKFFNKILQSCPFILECRYYYCKVVREGKKLFTQISYKVPFNTISFNWILEELCCSYQSRDWLIQDRYPSISGPQQFSYKYTLAIFRAMTYMSYSIRFFYIST